MQVKDVKFISESRLDQVNLEYYPPVGVYVTPEWAVEMANGQFDSPIHKLLLSEADSAPTRRVSLSADSRCRDPLESWQGGNGGGVGQPLS